MGNEYDPSSSFGAGNYLSDLGKLSLDNAPELNLYESEPGFDQDYLDAISADAKSDSADLPGLESPIIPEATEDMSY